VSRFIVLEGGEGVGKSTQAALLAGALGAVLTREPGGTSTGEDVRNLVLDRSHRHLHARAETLLMLAARAQHVEEVIRPALEEGRDVVCDRFSGSTLAYQGYGRGLELGELAGLDAWARAGCEPDMVVLLDLAVRAGRRRRPAGPRDRFEHEEDSFLERVRAGFLELARNDPARWRVVDASGSVEEVADAVAAAVGPGAR
jgi:dTMP kinase